MRPRMNQAQKWLPPDGPGDAVDHRETSDAPTALSDEILVSRLPDDVRDETAGLELL